MPTASLVVTLGEHLYSVGSAWASLPAGLRFTSISAVAVAVDSHDRLYVFQRADPPVIVFDRNGTYEMSWGDGLIADAHGMFISRDDRVFLVDRDGHQVLGFDLEGRLEITLGQRHRPRLQAPFNHPTDVAIGPDRSIYVADGYANAAIHCFSPDGELRWTRGRPGRGPGEFVTPHGIWVDDDGRILVADRENDRIQLWDSDGNYLSEWGGFYHPMDICMDRDGQIYVTEQVPRLSVLSPDGTLVGRCRSRLIPHGVCVDSRGAIYLADRPGDVVNKLVRLPETTPDS